VTKTACVIYFSDKRFEEMARNAAKSFKKFHPDVDVYLYDSYHYVDAFGGVFPTTLIGNSPPGVSKFILASWTAVAGAYEKIIILGSDVIVCDYLKEFFDDNKSDVIGTLDFNYPLTIVSGFADSTDKLNQAAFTSPLVIKDEKEDIKKIINLNPILEDITDEREIVNSRSLEVLDIYKHIYSNSNLYEFQFVHLNADVVCFNNIKYLKYVVDFATQNIQLSQRWQNNIPVGFINEYHEQGSLNFCTFAGWSGNIANPFDIGLENLSLTSRDMKYPKIYIPELYDEDIIYNVRAQFSQENIWKEYQDRNLYHDFTFPSGAKKDIDFIKQYYIDDNKLYTSEGKQIKVWHYCDDFGRQTKKDFLKLEQKWIDIFNEDTKNFFSNNCDCGDYFK